MDRRLHAVRPLSFVALLTFAAGCSTPASSIAAHPTTAFPVTWSGDRLAAAGSTSAAPTPPPAARPPAPARTADATVVLKRGERITGRITAQSPGDWVTIEEGGRSRTFTWDLIDEVAVGGGGGGGGGKAP